MPGCRQETEAKLGGDGVPAQGQLQALGHRAPASGKNRLGDSERVSNSI
jgi:hypothetical protein